jgi:hypothetical protein
VPPTTDCAGSHLSEPGVRLRRCAVWPIDDPRWEHDAMTKPWSGTSADDTVLSVGAMMQAARAQGNHRRGRA